jgi:hypothetical protein
MEEGGKQAMSTRDIKVNVTRHRDRKHLVMYYDCPLTGKRHTRSTEKANKRDAE